MCCISGVDTHGRHAARQLALAGVCAVNTNMHVLYAEARLKVAPCGTPVVPRVLAWLIRGSTRI